MCPNPFLESLFPALLHRSDATLDVSAVCHQKPRNAVNLGLHDGAVSLIFISLWRYFLACS